MLNLLILICMTNTIMLASSEYPYFSHTDRKSHHKDSQSSQLLKKPQISRKMLDTFDTEAEGWIEEFYLDWSWARKIFILLNNNYCLNIYDKSSLFCHSQHSHSQHSLSCGKNNSKLFLCKFISWETKTKSRIKVFDNICRLHHWLVAGKLIK